MSYLSHCFSYTAPDGNIRIGGPCFSCGDVHTVTVTPAGLKAWGDGAPIQTALSELSAADREFLISGECPECFEALFAPEGEPEPDDDEIEAAF